MKFNPIDSRDKRACEFSSRSTSTMSDRPSIVLSKLHRVLNYMNVISGDIFFTAEF